MTAMQGETEYMASSSQTRDLADSDLAERMRAAAAAVETLLVTLLSDSPRGGETERPSLLMEAMRHGALGGGKRFRPFLVMETAALFGVSGDGPLRAGTALELVHCYSLVHDDLPAMDNDDLRRGKPTVHKAYGDDMGILVGDGLLTMAFDVLTDEATARRPQQRIALVRLLAQGAGVGGMVGGQLLDLAAEGRYAGRMAQPAGEDGVRLIQSMKTGALIRAATAMGSVLGDATPKQRLALDSYSQALGLAFQIKDDLLDVESDAATLGKAAGKDAGAGKATFVSLHGVDGARRILTDVTGQGEEALAMFGSSAAVLKALLDFNLTRKS
jgi:farnesyl diphosphate synthase